METLFCCGFWNFPGVSVWWLAHFGFGFKTWYKWQHIWWPNEKPNDNVIAGYVVVILDLMGKFGCLRWLEIRLSENYCYINCYPADDGSSCTCIGEVQHSWHYHLVPNAIWRDFPTYGKRVRTCYDLTLYVVEGLVTSSDFSYASNTQSFAYESIVHMTDACKTQLNSYSCISFKKNILTLFEL